MSQPFTTFTIEAARRYDAWYDTPAGRAMAGAEEALLASLLSPLPEARSVLEVGCGTGHFSRWFAGRGLAVVGLDPAGGMLAVARERGEGPSYVAGWAGHLPFPDESFDLVAFLTSFEFVPDPPVALREAARVARRGLLLGVLSRASPLGLWRKGKALLQSSPYRAARFYAPWTLARLVRHTLGSEVRGLAWQTALWPAWVPRPARRLPFGAFVGLLATLGPGTSLGLQPPYRLD